MSSLGRLSVVLREGDRVQLRTVEFSGILVEKSPFGREAWLSCSELSCLCLAILKEKGQGSGRPGVRLPAFTPG